MRCCTIRLLLLPVLLSACIRPPAGSYSNLPPQGAPYIQLKNGDTLSGNVVLKTPFLGRTRVEVNDQPYKATDVAFFQDDKARYANIGRSTFAPQVVDGNIKLFRSISTYTSASYSGGAGGGMQTSTHTRIDDYMLPADGNKLLPFNYTNLRAAIPASASASTYLGSYLKTQRTGRIITYAGLAAMIGGVFLAASGPAGESSSATTVGGTMFLLGFPTIYVGIGKSASKRKFLYKALDAYNDGPVPARRGRRR